MVVGYQMYQYYRKEEGSNLTTELSSIDFVGDGLTSNSTEW